jgi:hypothetical protein
MVGILCMSIIASGAMTLLLRRVDGVGRKEVLEERRDGGRER